MERVGTLGVLHGIADAFQIPYDQKMIFIWIVLSSVIWGIAFGNGTENICFQRQWDCLYGSDFGDGRKSVRGFAAVWSE